MCHHVVNRSIEDIYWLMVISVWSQKSQNTIYAKNALINCLLVYNTCILLTFSFGVLENDAWLDHVMTCSRSFVIPIFRTYISYRIDRLPNDWHFKTMFNYYI